MPLADYITQLGGRTALGQVGRVFGGQTDREKVMAQFVNGDLPVLTENLRKATTRQEIQKAGGELFKAAVAAGVGPRSLAGLQEGLIKPALEGMQAQDRDALLRDYGPRPAQPRPEGVEGPMTEGGNFIDPSAGRPRDLEFNIRAANAGIKPDDIGHFLQNPEDIQSKQLSNQKTQQSLEVEAAKQRDIARYRNEPQANETYSPQTALRFGFGPQILPQREKPEDPLLEERKGLITAQTAAANAQAGAANALATYRNDRVPPTDKPDKPMSDKDLRTAYQRALIDREKLKRNFLVAPLMGETEGYDAADAQFKALEQEMKQRGLLPSTPTQPAGQGRYSRGVPTGSAPAGGTQGTTAQTGTPQAQPTGGARPRARNPKTGEEVEWDGRQWIKVK